MLDLGSGLGLSALICRAGLPSQPRSRAGDFWALLAAELKPAIRQMPGEILRLYSDGHDVPHSPVSWDSAPPGRRERPRQQPWQQAHPEPGTVGSAPEHPCQGTGEPSSTPWEGTLNSAPTLTPLGFSQAAPLYCIKFLLVVPQHHDRSSLLKHTH